MGQRILAQNTPGVEPPGLALDRIVTQVNNLWDAYGGLVLVGVAALVVAAACYVVVRVVRRVPANRLRELADYLKVQ